MTGIIAGKYEERECIICGAKADYYIKILRLFSRSKRTYCKKHWLSECMRINFTKIKR